MKKLLYNLAIVLAMMLSVSAQAQEQESRKTMQKSYPASGMTLKINNSYGKVHVNTNTGSQINVKVEMIAKASSKEKSDDILNKISVATTQSGNLIAFETVLEKISGMSWGGKTSFEINYTIEMPSSIPLEVYNKYGNTYLGNFGSKLTLQTAYGNIKAERLTGTSEKSLQVKYGNAQVAYLEQGSVYVAYGNLDLEQGGTVKLKNAYSNTEIGKITNLSIDNAYSNLEIEKVEELDGDSDYAGKFVVKSLGKSLKMTGSYNSSFKIEGIDKNCQSVNIDSKYSTCSLTFNEDAGCQFELNLKYGSLVGEKDKFTIQSKVIENTSAYYQGKYGKNTTTKVQISTKYGNIKIK